YLYRVLAGTEISARSGLFRELAADAEAQALLWEKKIRETNGSFPARYSPDLRSRIVAALVRRFGIRRMRVVLAAMKVRGMSLYRAERPGHPMPRTIEDVGGRHRGVSSGGNLRAAVFGVNDGLVSNASLIMGVAGATSNMSVILLGGAAGLLAGAFSMGAGEYISVRSQREMFEYQIGLEKDELDHYPNEEAAELALIYEARGLPKEEASRMARTIIAKPGEALDTLAREELGLNPEELGSPLSAALYSFFSFAAGAFVPLVPFIFAEDALVWAAALTAAALFCVGMTISLFTGRRAFASGLRMLAIGAAAGGVTYLLGNFLGVALN
ncbi:MAG: VIT1/CCC1 transporter family protein, partial [Burkholderiales bacterium]